MAQGKIEVVISKKTGDSKIEMSGYKGNTCAKEAEDILKAAGGKVTTKKNKEFYQGEETRVRQSR